jgi:hypothetical protein
MALIAAISSAVLQGEVDADRLLACLNTLPLTTFPLQQAIVHGTLLAETPPRLLLDGYAYRDTTIEVDLTILFASWIAGCHCGDGDAAGDPLPEICRLHLTIDRHSGAVRCVER